MCMRVFSTHYDTKLNKTIFDEKTKHRLTTLYCIKPICRAL